MARCGVESQLPAEREASGGAVDGRSSVPEALYQPKLQIRRASMSLELKPMERAKLLLELRKHTLTPAATFALRCCIEGYIVWIQLLIRTNESVQS
jgi:hypothetical protein